MSTADQGLWAGASAYEAYMGRWSRRIAPLFLDWLAGPTDADWIDVGSGTGVLSASVLARCAPRRVVGVDPSAAFLGFALAQTRAPRFSAVQALAEALPCGDAGFKLAVSGLMLNFVADKDKAVAACVWDYAGQMQIMRHFFDAATELDRGAAAFDDGVRAPVCRPGPLTQLFERAGLACVEVQALDITAAFKDFDDYWQPFLGGTGSAPRYCASLAPEAKERLREAVRQRLPTGPDGEILLAPRAWAVKGQVLR